MIKIRRNCKENWKEVFRSQTERKHSKNRGLRDFVASAKSTLCYKTSSQPQTPLCKNFRSCKTTFGTRVPLRSTGAPISKLRIGCEAPKLHSAGYFADAKHILAHECHFAAQWPSFRSCKTATKSQNVKNPNFAAKAPFCKVFQSSETTFWHTSAIWKPRTLISQLRNGCETSTP